GALLCDRIHDYDGAIAAFSEAIRLDPNFASARANLARALGRKGDASGAAVAQEDAIRRDPKNHFALNGLAWLLATGRDKGRDGKRAVEYATRACELTGWKDPNNIDTLAAAHAEAGDFDKALEHLKKARALPGAEEQWGPGFRERLALYERKQPYRD